MSLRIQTGRKTGRIVHAALVVAMAALGVAAVRCQAQNDDVNLSLRAKADKTTAADIGLPSYPGATPYKKSDSDSGSADLGFSFGDFKFSLQVAQYQTADPAWKVFGFYRTALGKYGDVLECNHGKPVGSPTMTHSGLTCEDDDKKKGGGMHAGDSSDSHELRAGTPKRFRVVGLSDSSTEGKTRFTLMYIELPKDSDEKTTN